MNIFKIEHIKLASMGSDTIVYIPRVLVKYKNLDPKKRHDIYFEEIKE